MTEKRISMRELREMIDGLPDKAELVITANNVHYIGGDEVEIETEIDHNMTKEEMSVLFKPTDD